MFGKIRFFIPFAVAITGLCGLIYITVQQNIRASANDPQIQVSENIQASLNNGVKPQNIVGKQKIDISKNLSTFVIIFSENGQPISSSAILSGTIPTIPTGVFDSVKNSDEDRFTWQPAPDVRIATVVTKSNAGFVLVGRNLREVEKRENNLTMQVFAAWVIIMAATFVSTFIFIPAPNKK